MKVNCRESDNNLFVELEGEFDLHTADYFKKKVSEQLTTEICNLILDLDGIEFIDSSGLGAILSIYKKLNQQGGKVGVVNITSQVERIFEVSGLLKIIDIYHSQQELLDKI
ncbi:STAS domain-containing protein [Natroniella sulfidigena]|uniref:STAS domain-containing protein n=1 Tax=Natroniella sulfidigena TaxID=723921 RepID=UPI00200AF5DB|nr:anti-sigma factor antagonist [Natroniella sulfidigena]MCK8816592.1 STAS domain-containing protein [Natroniella sulfidigena]